MKYDVAVIGGGPAGMAAAVSAHKNGAKTLIIERDARLGGILNQCIHNGFGLHYFGEELTGPEYAARFVSEVESLDIDVLTDSFVTDLTKDNRITVVSAGRGVLQIDAAAVVLAMGCRERTAGAIAIPGERPAGVWTAGLAQRLANVDGYLTGKKVVILGSGDIGLIMARRMTFEGAKVVMVCEIMPYSSGLKRNIVQCLDDFGIPLRFSTTVAEIKGKERVTGVVIASVDEKLNIIPSTKQLVECDALLLSVGLIPEIDLVADIGIQFHPKTGGAVVNDFCQTSIKGIFACGNVLHVHDLVDNVTAESILAGKSAALFSRGELPLGESVNVLQKQGVSYALPQKIVKGEGEAKIFFRADNVYKAPKITVVSGDKVLYEKKKLVMAPGEMESVTLDKKDVTDDIFIGLETK